MEVLAARACAQQLGLAKYVHHGKYCLQLLGEARNWSQRRRQLTDPKL